VDVEQSIQIRDQGQDRDGQCFLELCSDKH
jgi:hypothetical protein